MPKLTERERLVKLETDQRELAREADRVRIQVRAHYGSLIGDLAVEAMTEREFRDLVQQAIRAGGSHAVAALKALPPTSQDVAGTAPLQRARRSRAQAAGAPQEHRVGG